MATRMGIYKCNVCGNIVEVFIDGIGDLVCCGEEMQYMEEKTADFAVEKHVPYIEKNGDGCRVKVGENTAHPMTEEHYIQWIELIDGSQVLRQELSPGDPPEAEFCMEYSSALQAREYCNVHGHWKS